MCAGVNYYGTDICCDEMKVGDMVITRELSSLLRE